MSNRTKKLSFFPDLLRIENVNTQNIKFPLLDLRELDPIRRNKNIKFDTLKDEILNRNTIPFILYVNKKGSDTNDGLTPNSAKATIKGALEAITNTPFFNKTQDAANLILRNKEYIVDEAFIQLRSAYPSLYGAPNTPINALGNKCKRDLGYILEAVVKDLRLGGNLNVIEAAASYYKNSGSGSLLISDVSTHLTETLFSFYKLRDLIKYALDGWRGYSGGTSQVEKQYPVLSSTIGSDPNDPNYVIDGDCSDVKSAVQTYFDIIYNILVNGINTITISSGPINTTIYVSPGTYVEENPLYIPPNVAIIGDNLRTANVVPKYPNQDIFNVNNGVYIYGFSFSGHVDGAAVVSFPDKGAGVIVRSPYVQNCTSLTSTGTGMRVDGNKAQGLKSMVLDAFSQYNQGGNGIEIINGGYAQLVSIFEICCDKAVYVNNGGTCSITNSNTDFGNYGLYAEGVGPQQYIEDRSGNSLTQRLVINNEDDVSGLTFKVSGIPEGQKPYVGQGITIGKQYYFIKDVVLVDPGAGYSFAPTINVQAPSEPAGIPAEILCDIDSNGSISDIKVAVSGTLFTTADFAKPGSYYTETPENGGREVWDGTLNEMFLSIVPAPSGPGARSAVIQIIVEPIYYTVASSTPRNDQGVCEVTILEKLPYTPQNDPISGLGPKVKFFQLSRMIVSSHCFEYVGSGTNISDAIPAKGGVPVQKNEVFTKDGGRIVFTSTDHIGNFRIGSDLVINQDTGTLSGRTFDKSLFNKLTPFILAIQ